MRRDRHRRTANRHAPAIRSSAVLVAGTIILSVALVVSGCEWLAIGHPLASTEDTAIIGGPEDEGADSGGRPDSPASSAATYTVTYEANNATSGSVPAVQTKTEGIDLTLAENTGGLARSGFTFAGWNTANDGNGTSYAEGATYSADADVTLYAAWTYVEYAIGDTGPAGGVVFYDDEAIGSDDIAGARYLEAAPASTESNDIEWGDYGTEIGGDAQLMHIGGGQAATDAIVAHMEGESITGTAAQVADALSHNGYNDWFLPSYEELDLMYRNLHLNSNGGFASANYWSSSEYNSDRAWNQNFFGGDQSNDLIKPNTLRVRAVRAF